MIPKIIHFTWLTPPTGKEFKIFHMASVKSVNFYNPGYKIRFHCNEAPTGIYFDAIRDIVDINIVDTPEEVFGIPINYMANKSDVLRMRTLIEEGGIYQDLDVYAMRSYDALLGNEVCMGYELSPTLNPRQVFYFLRTLQFDVLKYKFRVKAGLCNGFIMTDKNSAFLKDWYEGYRKFDPDKWNYFSVKLPYQMVSSGKYNVHTLNPYLTHFPSCSEADLKLIFEKNLIIKDKYFLHVWESRSYKKYLEPLTREMILKSNNTFCNAIKKFV